MNVSDAQRLKALKAENTKLKKLLASSMHVRCGKLRKRPASLPEEPHTTLPVTWLARPRQYRGVQQLSAMV